MNEIRSILRFAGRRLEGRVLLSFFSTASIVLAVVILLLSVADRSSAASFVPWAWVVPALAVAALGIPYLVWRPRRLNEVEIALAVDDRLDLRERFSTALHCCGRDDAFAQAAVEDAALVARSPRVNEEVHRRFTLHAPKGWWISPLTLVIAIGITFSPQWNLFAREASANEVEITEAQEQAQEALEVAVKAVEENEMLKTELQGLIDEMVKSDKPMSSMQRPEDVKRDALKKITELNRKLDEIVNGERGKAEEQLRDMMSKLNTPEDGPAKDLADAMSKGDFKEAKQAIERLIQEAEAGGMKEERKNQLEQQLGDLANQLEKLAQDQEALQNALQAAGLNPQLANNPAALQQAIDQAQNLNDQQKQQLQQMMQAQQQAQQMCQGMAGAMDQMAQNLQQGQGLGQAGQQLVDQLNAAEQLQQMLQQAQAAAGQCQGGMCQGLGQGLGLQQLAQQQQQVMQPGGGMGQRGQGQGGRAPRTPTPTKTVAQKENVPIVEGEIIGMTLINGTPVTGESKARLREVTAAAAEGYDEAQSEEVLPPQYHDAQKHYFGELKKRVEALPAVAEQKGSDAPPPAKPAPDPAPAN